MVASPSQAAAMRSVWLSALWLSCAAAWAHRSEWAMLQPPCVCQPLDLGTWLGQGLSASALSGIGMCIVTLETARLMIKPS